MLSLYSIQGFASSCPDGSEPVKSVSDDGTYFVFNCESDTKINENARESGAGSVASKSIFVSDKDFNDFLNLPKEVRIRSCGYQRFFPNWREINKDLAPKAFSI